MSGPSAVSSSSIATDTNAAVAMSKSTLFQRASHTRRPGGIKVVVASPTNSRSTPSKITTQEAISSDMLKLQLSASSSSPDAPQVEPESPSSTRKIEHTENVSAEEARRSKIQKLLDDPNVDLDELKKLSWSGIPKQYRATVWKYLMDYLPTNSERRQVTLERKRQEYGTYLDRYFGQNTTRTEQEDVIARQILLDLPRTMPTMPLFQQKRIQKAFERVLYVWAIRHPASGYVQGINDLLAPLFVVFLCEYTDFELEHIDSSKIPEEHMMIAEADSFWCLSKLLDSIQDNYTFAQPGIQRQVHRLSELMNRVENKLHEHLSSLGILYLQFAFRWMNCLLIREIPLGLVIRMWDTYLVEENGFVDFHLYVCAAFLRSWSSQLLSEDFQGCILLLQNLPTQTWSERDLQVVLADAYRLKTLFHEAPSHLKN
eukprot:TRINITY_DN5286_c0_g1_i1.p1 TRINITY_DN5286_c0_g1~~TRINITY_DN5286_c0_g1_i1.p1  ORF type:complete len:429 (+),score=84.67 TRINITY_DN5286_c0_g1_i1:55-1341(+)